MITQNILNKKLKPIYKGNIWSDTIFIIYMNYKNELITNYKDGINLYITNERLNCPNIIKSLLLSKDKYKIELGLNLL